MSTRAFTTGIGIEPGRDRPIRAVLYDFDGTLADTTELILRSFRHTMALFRDAVPPDEEWTKGFGTTLEAQMDRFARSPAEARTMIEEYRRFQNEHHDALLRHFPDTVEVLDLLRARGIALGVVTSKFRPGALKSMRLCGILDHFAAIVTPEDVVNAKPHPEPVNVALQRLGARADEAIFIGDSPHDIAAGQAAGTRTGAALWGPFSHIALEAARPDYLFERPTDILALVQDSVAS